MVNNFRFQWGLDNEIIGANGTGPSVSITNLSGYGLPITIASRLRFPDADTSARSYAFDTARGRTVSTKSRPVSM